jgi:hypothetical protein
LSRLGALDALGRGLANVRANWELLLAQLGAVLLTTMLVIGSLAPLVLALGFSVAAARADPGQELTRILSPATWLSAGVLAAVVGALLVGTAAFALYAWFQAGIYGVLVAGDRQAGGGPGRPRLLFRTFSWPDFMGWAARGIWRLFGWYHVYFAILSGAALLIGALVGGAVLGGMRHGALAGFGIGCGGALPLVFLLVWASLCAQAAKADVVRAGSGALAAWRRGGRVVGRRLGASLLLLVLMVAASLAVSLLLLPLELLRFVARDDLGAQLAMQGFTAVVQMLVGTVLGLVFGAAFVALVRAELPDPA